MITTIEEEGTRRTGGHYQAQSFCIDVLSGDTTKDLDVSFPIPVALLSASWKEHAEYQGDYIEMGTIPAITGTITENVTANDTVFNVSSTVGDNARIGGFLQITDGTNTDILGHILDIGDGTVTCNIPSSNSFLASTPTYCKFHIEMYRKSPLDRAYNASLGESKIGGSYIPANSVLRAKYYNDTATAKKFIFTLEYLY